MKDLHFPSCWEAFVLTVEYQQEVIEAFIYGS